MANENKPHYFHAEAHALKGKLELPFDQDIKPQSFVKLEKLETEKEKPDYLSQHSKNYRLEGIISFAAAHTQVSGHESQKHVGARVTLATSVVEDLNVLNVVTADRVVAQISTTHFPNVPTPSVTFLGTHFENLRIARHKAEPFLNLGTVGEKPDGKDAMYVGKGTGFMTAVEAQYKRLKASLGSLGAEKPAGSLAEKYHGFADLNYGDINERARAAQADGKAEAKAGRGKWDGITCSLVENVEIKDISVKGADGKSVEIPPPAKSAGHVIHIPDFGTIFLAELTVDHNSFNLTMIRLELGCLADGKVSISTANVNGGSKGGGG
jgi:hypothetical protein